MGKANIKLLHDTNLYVAHCVQLYWHHLPATFCKARGYRGIEHPQVLHIAKIQNGRRVDYRVTLLDRMGIGSVDLKGSDSTVIYKIEDGRLYHHWDDERVYSAKYQHDDEVIYNDQIYKVLHIFNEGYELGFMYDLTNEHGNVYDIPQADLTFWGSPPRQKSIF